MPAFVRVQISIPSDTLIPRDAAVNTWHFRSDGLDAEATAGNAIVKLTSFYQAIDGTFGAHVSSPAAWKAYDLSDALPRVPLGNGTFVLSPSSQPGLPPELAVVLSYSADPSSGVSAARRRGRVYLGPFGTSALSSAGGKVNVDVGTLATIQTAADLLHGGNETLEAIWSVFSPTTAGSEPWTTGQLSSAFFDVTQGFLDDAWDIVRSRGTAASTRLTFN